MTWGALLGGLIGAGIPGLLTYMGLRRGRQSNDAEAFGPALLLLHRLQPDGVMWNVSSDAAVEAAKWEGFPEQIAMARERLLVVRAGNPRRRVRDLAGIAEIKLGNVYRAMGYQLRDMLTNRDNPEWVVHYRETYSEADRAMRDLIEANFAWIHPRLTAIVRRVRGWLHV
jgi:hypothetical protein